MEGNTLAVILIVSFFILFSGIGILLILMHQKNKRKAEKSLSWPETKGTIIKSEVVLGESVFSNDDEGESQPMHSAEVSYTYQVEDTLYTSDRISFATKSSYSRPDKAEAVTKLYPEGSQVTVYYDPDHHDIAVLERSAKGSGALLAAGIVFLSIGLITVIVGILILTQSVLY